MCICVSMFVLHVLLYICMYAHFVLSYMCLCILSMWGITLCIYLHLCFLDVALQHSSVGQNTVLHLFAQPVLGQLQDSTNTSTSFLSKHVSCTVVMDRWLNKYVWLCLSTLTLQLRLGIARETVGSILLEVTTGTTWHGIGSTNARLYNLALDMRSWCKSHKLDTSIVDELSLNKLKMKSGADYPVLSGQGDWLVSVWSFVHIGPER